MDAMTVAWGMNLHCNTHAGMMTWRCCCEIIRKIEGEIAPTKLAGTGTQYFTMDTFSTLALITGVGWASGVRLYAVLFFLGALHNAGIYVLPHNLQLLAHPAVMTASGLLLVAEFFADKVPGFDSLWDAVHTFIRIPAAALLGAAAVAGGDPGLVVAAGLLSGAIATGTHLTKAGSRVLINASPEPVSNWSVSFGEDALVLAGVWTAVKYPMLFLLLLVVFLLLLLWLVPRLWRGIKRLFAMIRRVPKIPA